MNKLTMDIIARYRIIIPGELPQDWLQFELRMEIEVTRTEYAQKTTTLEGKLDQAALIGLLRRLNSLGIPLRSVECIDFK